MPRMPKKAEDIEIQRMEMLHKRRQELVKRIDKPLKVKKSGFLPGEENQKKMLAIIYKLADPGMSYTAIAALIREPKTVVKRWFREDAFVKEQYMDLQLALDKTALDAIQMYNLEAVMTLASLMRFGSEKYMYEAAIAILDRGGAPKVSKQQGEFENTKKHKWDDNQALIDQMRALPPAQQEEFAATIEKLENLVMQAAQADESTQNNNQITEDADDAT